MARCDVQMPEDFMAKLSKLGSDLDQVCESALKAGGEVVLQKVQTNLNGIVGRNTKEGSRSTGELQRSLGLSRVLIDKNGNSNIKVGFAEPRSDGDSNAKIANILEYGSSKQAAKPFLKPAKSQSKSAAVEAMKSVLEEEISKR